MRGLSPKALMIESPALLLESLLSAWIIYKKNAFSSMLEFNKKKVKANLEATLTIGWKYALANEMISFYSPTQLLLLVTNGYGFLMASVDSSLQVHLHSSLLFVSGNHFRYQSVDLVSEFYNFVPPFSQSRPAFSQHDDCR